MQKLNKKSQVWVETAIYTLIGLTIIAILLAIANPQINKIKDRSMINQGIQIINTLDEKILYIEQSPGSIAVPSVKIGAGRFIINSSNDSIGYVLANTELEFTQIGSNIRQGNLFVRTEKYGNNFNVFVTRYYNLNITYNGNETTRYLESSSVPYRIRMENKGQNNIDVYTLV
jgi:hypothetical protein